MINHQRLSPPNLQIYGPLENGIIKKNVFNYSTVPNVYFIKDLQKRESILKAPYLQDPNTWV